MIFRGLDITSPLNRLKAGFACLAVNTRAYFVGGFMLRNLLTNAILTVSGVINTLARLNDSTPAGPISGYTIITAAGTFLFNNTTLIATGMSGNPVSMVPFRPNASVQPWEYIGDVSPAPAGTEAQNNVVTLTTKSLYSGAPVSFASTRMNKVRSDGLIYKMGVKEPQLAPIVSTEDTSTSVSGMLLATAIPWTNFGGANPDFNYGESNGFPSPSPDGTAPFVVNVLNASTITITSLTGTATINGGPKTPASAGPSTALSTNPGHYIQIAGSGGRPASATVVVGAFIDASGNVMPVGVAPLFVPSVVDVGAVIGIPNAIQIPAGAVSFQIGINSTGNTFSANSGSFSIVVTVVTDALAPNMSIVGTLSLYAFGDSPTSGPVAGYIWRNPDDSGGGPTRTISGGTPILGNSFLFDCTLVNGIPGPPGIGNSGVAMQWFQLNPDESVSGITSLPPFANFNFCLFGQIYIPEAGNYTFLLRNHDDCIWGIEGCTFISAVPSGPGEGGNANFGAGYGQTITVVNGYPLLPRQAYTSGDSGDYAETTVIVNFSSAGVYGIEIDYDYWYHDGRILLLTASPTPGADPEIIPPGKGNQRQNVQYRYVYRSSATGATSNPSPESSAITLPVSANTVTSLWSPDPQIDVVDYYRLDSVTSEFTYVNTGPNDNLGEGGTNTPVTDSLTDTELGTQLLSFDNFEPFPSIDLPQKGTCTISGGVITWVSGGSIGGSATGFNTRWLAGTVIIIGSPTGLAYTLIARPTSTTSMTIPGVPDGTNVQYTIAEPILAAQALPYLWGPSDNIPYTCGCGDKLRPGTMYWCEGNNLDAAPDTNQQDITDPSEPLVNGVYSGGRGIVFTILRAVAVVPNFYNALATATGTVGGTWSVQTTGITRGLFMPRCLAVDGGGTIFFRVNDGIHASPGGGESQSITDDSIYNLFPHENSTPRPITRNGIAIYPPDDSQPQKQKFSIIDAYLYYLYVDTTGVQRQIVFDIAAKGWIWDTPTPTITAFATNEDVSTQGVIAGCSDGTVRQFSSTNSATESATATVMSGALGGVGWGHTRLITVEYSSNAPITLSFVCPDASTNGSIAPNTIILPSTGGTVTKWKTLPSFNKFKLLQTTFTHNDPTAQIYLDGFILEHKDWGSSGGYMPVNPFDGNSGGAGGQP